MTKMRPIGIGKEISERFGYDPNLVRQIVITRDAITFTLYETDENGAKYIGEDGEPATNEAVYRSA